jgi:uncharacterized BrkB/YihY/UPF0761 family membrane protein
VLPPPDPTTRAGPPAPPAPPRPSGLRTLPAQAKEKSTALRANLEATRPQSTTVDVVFSSLEHDTASGGPVLAGAIAFRIFLFLVPYVFVLVYGFGLAADAANTDPQSLAKKAGIAGLLASTIHVAADQSITTRLLVLAGAVVALVSAARTVVKVLAIVHDLIWRLPIRPVAHLTRAALAFIGIVTGGIILVQSFEWLRDRSAVAGLVAVVLFAAIPGGLWLWVSVRHLPRAPGATWRDLLPGAVAVGFGVLVLHVVTVYWIVRQLESKSETYGAMGAALALLLWAYVFGRVLAGGAVVNAALWYRRHAPVVDANEALRAEPDRVAGSHRRG